ncbi:MAG: iron-containing alcohol dehydrogenase [bacterium]|nr:iron-containing alcohol dehydrogenase [bacterium]
MRTEEAGEVLTQAAIEFMKNAGMPNGLSAVGYTEADVDKLVEGTLLRPSILLTYASRRLGIKSPVLKLKDAKAPCREGV